VDREGIKRLAEILDASILSAPLSAKWMNISCPFAAWSHEHGVDKNPSFGVQIKKNAVSRLFCFSCQKSAGSLGELIMELKALGSEVNFKELNALADAEWDGSDLPSFDDELDEETLLFPFAEDWLESFPLAVNSGPALMYLANREGGPVPKSIMSMLDLRYDPFEKRVCFPIRGTDGVCYGLHGRDVTGMSDYRYMAYGYKKRRNPHVMLGEDKIDWNRKVVLAEGPFDYARVAQVYRNVISPLHAGMSEDMLERLAPVFELVTLFDPDKAGDAGRKKIRKWAGKKRIVEHCILPEGMDAAKMSAEALADELKVFVDPDPFLL
jgi:5S rRNA maturation endonuclease (ribonuclease M5)